MSTKPQVTITGISGFIGAEVCLAFLNDGGFKVRGTVRSKDNKAKIDPLKKAFKKKFDELEIVEADLMDHKSLVKAIEGSEYVVHTASPVEMVQEKDAMKVI